MAVLIPAPFKDLVTRLYREPAIDDALWGLPRRKWFRPDPAGPDLGVRFHGRRAANPVGPAAGPHTQMAQNILLSYVAGARILELKTVQVNDGLTIPRPCIDMASVGYNVEWSQELPIGDSVREYVAGAMLIHMFRHHVGGREAGLDGPAGDVIHDVSVGYNLAGIRTAKVRRFLAAMRDASKRIEQLRAEIPPGCPGARDLDYPVALATSVTLSTFHGCPADEIERICEFLLDEEGFHVCVKLNPPTLGRQETEHLLHDVMGYTDIQVDPRVYATCLSLDEAVQLCDRLTHFAAARGRTFGVKLCNTLEVRNHRRFFPRECETMYLSGQPLYVIVLALADALRQRLGADLPISYSGGVDKWNFPDVVACGFVPVTVCTDLLRAGGYGRLPAYLQRLTDQMRDAGATNIDEYIRHRAGGGDGSDTSASIERTLSAVAQRAREDERYRAEKTSKPPPRIDSSLTTFDCITCDKCIPVCPNAANFTYPSPEVSRRYHDVIVEPDGAWRPGPAAVFDIRRPRQIACFADFCNECGNCDTFCPERGAPYLDKPVFFGHVESWLRAAPRDGWVIDAAPSRSIRGRVAGRHYELEALDDGRYRFRDGPVELTLEADGYQIADVRLLDTIHKPYDVNVGVYHTLNTLLSGVLDPRCVNPVHVPQ